MSFVTPPDFVAGTELEEGDLDILGTDIAFLANPPRCRVYNSANISHATSGVAQALTFNSERYDTDTMHSTAVNTERITFTTGGTYDVFSHVAFAVNPTGYRQAYIRLNATTIIVADTRAAAPGEATHLTAATTYDFSAGDYIEVYANQTSGAALNVVALGNYSPEFGATLRAV